MDLLFGHLMFSVLNDASVAREVTSMMYESSNSLIKSASSLWIVKRLFFPPPYQWKFILWWRQHCTIKESAFLLLTLTACPLTLTFITQAVQPECAGVSLMLRSCFLIPTLHLCGSVAAIRSDNPAVNMEPVSSTSSLPGKMGGRSRGMGAESAAWGRLFTSAYARLQPWCHSSHSFKDNTRPLWDWDEISRRVLLCGA